MKAWFTIEEAVALGDPDMPGTVRGWNKLASSRGWRGIDGKARRVGKGWEYHVSLLPSGMRERLAIAGREVSKAPRQVSDPDVWARYTALSQKHKDACARRLEAVEAVSRLKASGYGTREAVAVIATRFDVSSSSVRNWLKRVKGHARTDWLAALAPEYKATATFAECHPAAWEALKADYLRPQAPPFSACYRRMAKAAKREGWPIPSEMALRRRLKAEVPETVQTLTRIGKDKAKTLYPAQRRSRAKLKAMTCVNIDGHRFDVMVRKGDGKPFRPLLVAIQDVYSGKFVGWRLDETESRVPVRLAIGDMVEQYGIPDHMILDNGRGFASKWITGGTPNRYRFKVRDEEPEGLLTALGVTIHWATPYAGQSKPIERAWRDVCEEIAKHPFCAGAYTGNSPVTKPENYGSRAIEWDAFKAFIDDMMVEHNARAGRTTKTAKGGSFDDAFSRSLEQPDTIVQWPTAAQRDLWLLMAEEVTARRGSGELHLMGNRYWSPELTEWAGRKLCVRFDPDNLTRDIKVYARDGRLICTAEAVGDVDFLDAGAAHEHSRRRAAYLKAQRQLRDLHVTMKPEELGQLYAPARVPARDPQKPAVTRLVTRGNAALKAASDPDVESWTDDHEAAFANVVRMRGGKLLKDQ